MTGPLVCGIDVSPLRLGWGLVTLDDGKYHASGHHDINLSHDEWRPANVDDAFDSIVYATTGGEVSVVGVELPWIRFPKNAFMAGRAVQAAVGAARKRFGHAEFHELQPGEWRKLAGLPNQGKAPVALAAAALYPGDMTQDECDGVMIAVAAQRLNIATWQRAVERGAA